MTTSDADRRGGEAVVASRELVLEAALAEVAEVGPGRASLRSIARRVGMTHQSVGYHFATRDVLLTALAARGYQQLVRRTELQVEAVPADAVVGSRVIAVGVAYVEFAQQHRALFDLLVDAHVLDATDPALQDGRARIWGLLTSTVEGEAARGWGGGVGTHELAVMAWTVVHGLATLGDLVPGRPAVATLLRTINEAIVRTPPTRRDGGVAS